MNIIVVSISIDTLMNDSAKGGLTLFWEHFTVIPCTPGDFKC